ncbi:hypothetical protein HMPREF9065_02005 [Aggregatibacter sp. oral taxon 458 str. W10330]|nr:hypothetical protein HMPREF9065_02005 [Aggregatibacter sp. oral taxon 458 str. W10330]
MNRSVQLVAQNRECLKEGNNVPCVVLSCNKLHATWNYARDVSVVHQDARYARNCERLKGLNNVQCVVWSCNKLHATHEIVNYASRLIIRATSCTLRGEIIRL